MRAVLLSLAVCAALAATAGAEPAQTGWVPLPEGMGDVVEAPSSRLLYLNRCAEGCAITPGFDDSRVDTSSIVSQTSFLAAYPWGDESWQRTVACVRTLYAAYDIEVTDVDPGSAPHFEAIVAGDPTDLGMNPAVGGVAPFSCGVIDNAITFTFAHKLGDQPQRICEVVGQESAHAFGLDHELLCQDPMTYQSGCGNKCFQDADAPCGEWMERECACGGDTQNSHATLTEIFGSAESTGSVAITEPADGGEVVTGFFVRAEAQVPCLAEIEAFVDDASLGVITAWPYVFNSPVGLVTGEHSVRVVARDHAGGEIEREHTVTLVEGGGGGDPGTGPCAGCPGGTNNPPRGGCTSGHGSGGAAGLIGIVGAVLWCQRRWAMTSMMKRRSRRS